MRGRILTFLFLFLNSGSGEKEFEFDANNQGGSTKLCELCTCSEIQDVDGSHLVLNILCSELDKIKDMPDLNKIEWPDNLNGLKISAAFEGLGLSTVGKLPQNTEVEALHFTNNVITAYWPEPFSETPNLKKLSLSHNQLSDITPDLFSKIEKLEDLDLSHNKISSDTLSPMDFKPLNYLRRLNLQGNILKRIPIGALQSMVVLEDLDLGKNEIYDVLLQRTDDNAWLRNLKRLNLNGNRIRSVMKDSFPLNNSIELLDLSNNQIEMVEEEAFLTCTSLRELNLAQNAIALNFALPSTLQIAILKINNLHNWPKFPSAIKYIDLSYNKLSDLYDENSIIFDNLEVLNIEGNQLKDFYIEKKLPKLFSLDLGYNLLTDIPKSLNSQNLPNLEQLRLDGNLITNIYFKNILAVKRLYMNELNNLTLLEDKAFSNVVGKGTDDRDNCFSLYLSSCSGLSEIREGTFYGTSLCLLDISKNNLTYLPKDLLNWSSLTEGVDLQWNPWDCSCDLQWVVDDLMPLLHDKRPELLAELRCSTPRALQGIRMVHMYNWTQKAMCIDEYGGNYLLQASRDKPMIELNLMNKILIGCIIGLTIIATGLTTYLVLNRKKYSRSKRRRQNTSDVRDSKAIQLKKLNKA